MDGQHSQRPKVTAGSGDPRWWKQLYLAANLELDPAKLPQRIDDARYAIIDRIADYFSAKSLDEEQATSRTACRFRSTEFPTRESSRKARSHLQALN
jgi:hypothetical protein